MQFPFEASFNEIRADPDAYVDAVFGSLQSEFMVMPRGKGFVEFSTFEAGYETLKRATTGFRIVNSETVTSVVDEAPVALLVLRCILGLSPPEWAVHAMSYTGVEITQGAARSIDRTVRMNPEAALAREGTVTGDRIRALIASACRLLESGVPDVPSDNLHRLDKADTRDGLASISALADLGVPYSMLLYERFLGRPFSSHRDSVSELVGNLVENAIEDVLTRAGISFRKTGRAERLPGFDQAPDFIVPNEFNPQVVIEAKLTEDDGTARDKVTRVQHLAALSRRSRHSFEVVACIAGRGFGVRREDMRKLLLATRGKIFTLQNMRHLVQHSRLHEFRSRPDHGSAVDR